MNPTDPVPPLPSFRPRDRVRVVDAKTRCELIRWEGTVGRIYGLARPGQPIRFVPDGDHRTFPVDTPRHSHPDALIVEPIQ